MDSPDTGARGDGRALPLTSRLRWWGWFTVRGFLADAGVDRSAALAYVTLLALVPLLATVAALYRSFFSTHTEAIVQVITVVLPYASETVSTTLAEFVRRAATLGGIASLIFVAVVFRLFLLIESTLNQCWGVAARRSASVRIFSFTMVLFWGPVVIGLGTTSLVWLERQPWAPSASLLLDVGRVGLPLVGLTMVYWLVPNTTVHLAAAAGGGALATIGLQLLRAGFLAYIRRFPDINLIFGSLALAVIFLVSLFAFWMLVIAGAEASYAAQNLPALLRSSRQRGEHPPEPVLTSLALLTAAYRVVERTAAPPTLDDLAHALSLTYRHAKTLLDRLVEARLLAVTGRDREHFLPVVDASRLTVGRAVAALEESKSYTVPEWDVTPMDQLTTLLGQARAKRQNVLDETTFLDLLGEE